MAIGAGLKFNSNRYGTHLKTVSAINMRGITARPQSFNTNIKAIKIPGPNASPKIRL